MTAPAVTRDLIVADTRALKLPGVERVFEALARQARDAHWPHEEYFHEVLSAEQHSRHEPMIQQRLREARFPEVATLDNVDFTATERVSATQIHPRHCARRRSDEAETAGALYAQLIWSASSSKPSTRASSRTCSSDCFGPTCRRADR